MMVPIVNVRPHSPNSLCERHPLSTPVTHPVSSVLRDTADVTVEVAGTGTPAGAAGPGKVRHVLPLMDPQMVSWSKQIVIQLQPGDVFSASGRV